MTEERMAGERGQAVPLVLAVVALAVVLVLALVPLGRRVDQRARAQAAADAAALAGAAEGEAAAREVAEANDAELVDWWAAGTDVWVQVQVGEVQARAQARRE